MKQLQQTVNAPLNAVLKSQMMKTHSAKNHEKALFESAPLVMHQQFAGKIGEESFN